MPRKPKPKPDDPEESRRFIELARRFEPHDDRGEFDRVFRQVATAKKTSRTPKNPRRK